ncbi:uncharacterized protein LOC119091969 [Pollicipes pollicipes]|uniref:uncharacterized protein LOC119091969 n=1 Tax=Pollicipes pollicipes TaxID=41117 RepID=UPI0018852352|nr:uncharacterized protein LOC119091969 [Pollicipes pollicipes]
MTRANATLLLLALCLAAAAAETAIIEQPADVLVTEGDEAVLKCKTDGEATRCKWLLNRTDNPYELVKVKEFYPKRDGDCSIRIKQVRQVHVGRWVCSVHISLLQDELVSRPATVAIATLEPRPRHPAIATHPVNTSALAGQPVDLSCRISSEVSACGWAMPDDVVITLSRTTMSLLDDVPLSFRGDLAAGDCSLRLGAMEPRFAGQWSCFFQVDGDTVWTSPAHLELAAAQARTGSALASVSTTMAAILVLVLVTFAAAVVGAVIYRRRRSKLHHAKMVDNPLYGIKNLQMAAAASAAERKAKEENRLNSVTVVAPPSAKGLQELGLVGRAPPNDYSMKGKAPTGEDEHKYAHVYDTPRKGHLYAVPSSKEAYQVPRSSYEIPPPPVKVDSGVDPENNVYEEVRSVLFRDEDMDGYLIPKEKLKP